MEHELTWLKDVAVQVTCNEPAPTEHVMHVVLQMPDMVCCTALVFNG